MTDLVADTKMLTELVAGLALAVGAGEDMGDLKVALTCWADLEEARKALAGVTQDLTKLLTAFWPTHVEGDRNVADPVVVEGVGVFERHGKRDRTQWDRDDLLRAVLDTKRANADGEPIEENPIDKILHVWNLPAPRLTALKERGLSPDDFCHSEWAGYSIRLVPIDERGNQ